MNERLLDINMTQIDNALKLPQRASRVTAIYVATAQEEKAAALAVAAVVVEFPHKAGFTVTPAHTAKALRILKHWNALL